MKKAGKRIVVMICLLMGVVACSSEPKIEKNPAEPLPYTYDTENINGEETYWRIKEIKVIEIDGALKEKIELEMPTLSADTINNLQDDYMLLTVTFEGKIKKDEGKSYRNWQTKFFQSIKFVRGDEILDTSLMSIGDILSVEYTHSDNFKKTEFTTEVGEDIDGVLLKKEYAEDENIQIKYKQGDSFIYFDIER